MALSAPTSAQTAAPDLIPITAEAPGLAAEAPELIPIQEDPMVRLAKLPRPRIVQEALEAHKQGRDIAPYRQAYAARAAEGTFFDEDRTGENKDQPNFFVRGWRGAQSLMEGAFKLVDNVTLAGGRGVVSGVQLPPRYVNGVLVPELEQKQMAVAKQAIDEVSAATQVGTIEGVNNLRQGVINVANKFWRSKGERTEADRRAFEDQFEADFDVASVVDAATKGEILPSTELQGRKAAVDAENVQQISAATDATMLIPISVGFKAARAPLAAGTLEKAAAPGFLARGAEKTTDAVARGLRGAQRAIDENALIKGVAAAGLTTAAGGDPAQAVLAGLLGANVKKLGVAKATLGKAADAIEQTGQSLVGKVPPGPIGRFAMAAHAAVSPELRGLVAGQLSNTPFLLGAQSEEEFQDMLATGMAAHVVGSGAGKVLNGLSISRNYFAPGNRSPEIRLNVKDIGADAALDVAHRKVTSELSNASNNFVQSIRDYFKDRGELYVVAPDDYNSAIDGLVKQGLMAAKEAEVAKQQQGFTYQVPGDEGPRNIALSKVTPQLPGLSIGHEAGHLLEYVLSAEELNHVYKETRKYYGDEQIAAYKERYEELANQNLEPGQPPVVLNDKQVLSEIFAEHASAVMNSIPVGKFGVGSGSRNYAREVYGAVGRALEYMGAKQPELAPTVAPKGKPTTGLGIEPSVRLSTIIENVIQAKRLDGLSPNYGVSPILATPEAAADAAPAAEKPAAPKPAAEAPVDIQGARPVEQKSESGLKKGDPVDEVRNAAGVLLAENAKISKDLGDVDGVRYFEIEYTHPDTGERMKGNVPESWLQSKVTPGAAPAGDVFPKSPVTPETPFGVAKAEDVVAPKQVENVTRPESEKPVAPAVFIGVQETGDGSPGIELFNLTTDIPGHPEGSTVSRQTLEAKGFRVDVVPIKPAETPAPATPNVRTTPEAQQALAGKPAAAEVVKKNLELLKDVNDRPRHAQPLVETDYYSAKSPIANPDQVVREKQRLAADAAEKSGEPNQLRTRFQKLFVPYRLFGTKDGGTNVFGMSLDKVAQNLDLLRGWLRLNPEGRRVLHQGGVGEYLTSPEIAGDLQRYLENQAHGYAGDGRKLARPADAKAITPEDPNFIPTKLPAGKAQVLNLLMGMEQPKTETPGQNFARRFAEANGILVAQVNGVSEPNSLRARLRLVGFDPRILNAVVENLRVDRMTTPLKPRGDLSFPAGDTGIQRAGFMPAPPRKGVTEWVEKAALRFPWGDVEVGRSHHSIISDLQAAGRLEGIQERLVSPDSGPIEDGFVTNRGKFLPRDEAMALARKVGQIPPIDQKAPAWSERRSTELESIAFDRGRAFMPQGPSAIRRARGNDDTRSVVKGYLDKTGIKNEPHEKYAPIVEDRMKRIADWFEQAKHEPNRPEVQEAYGALSAETKAQYEAMVDAGIQIEPFTGKGEPYANSTEMMRDVKENKHLWFFLTDSGFGEGADSKGNPLLAPSGVKIGGRELLMNDLFRAVHDYFGHTAEGYEFGPRGEFNAYLAHSRMFSDTAKPALAAETLAQNAWVNFGPHLRREDGSLPRPGEEGYKGQKERRFADQKSTIVPESILAEVDEAGQSAAYMPQTETKEFKKWFGDSKVVDETGKPLRMYHGTGTLRGEAGPHGVVISVDDFSTFKTPAYFTSKPGYASAFANARASDKAYGNGAAVYPVYLSIENPAPAFKLGVEDVSTSQLAKVFGGVKIPAKLGLRGAQKQPFFRWLQSYRPEVVQMARDGGFDGIEMVETDSRSSVDAGRVFVPFEPTQIKSTTGNRGTFDATNPDIRYMPAAKKFELGDTQIDAGDPYRPVLQGKKEVGRVEPDFANGGFRALSATRDDLGTAPTEREALALFTPEALKPKKDEAPAPKKVPAKKAPAPTGWVLPDGSYEGLRGDRFDNTGDFHAGVLKANADDYNKRFGLTIEDASPGDERLAALQKGFIRVRYDARTGRLGIEANKRFWNGKRRSKIEDVVEQNLNRIDRVDINLFDDEGNVVSSRGKAIFNLDEFEKSQAVLELIKQAPMREIPGAFMPTKSLADVTLDTDTPSKPLAHSSAELDRRPSAEVTRRK